MTSEDGPLLLRMTLLATSSDNLRQIKTKVIQKTLQVNVVKFFPKNPVGKENGMK